MTRLPAFLCALIVFALASWVRRFLVVCQQLEHYAEQLLKFESHERIDDLERIQHRLARDCGRSQRTAEDRPDLAQRVGGTVTIDSATARPWCTT